MTDTYVDLPDFVTDAKKDADNPGLAVATLDDGELIEAVEVPAAGGGTTLEPLESLEDFQRDPETGRQFADMIRTSFDAPGDASVADLLALLDRVCDPENI